MVGKGSKKRFTSDETAVFCEQIAMLLNSGIPLYEGTYILYSEMEDKAAKAVLLQVEEAVQKSLPFYEALKMTGAFPEYMVHMVQIGETTGKLEEVMHSLANYYERDSEIKAGIQSAVAYPLVLFGLMAAIMLIMVLKIIPIFETMFYELDGEVSKTTERMMNFGITTGRVAAIVTLGCLALFAAVLGWYKTADGEKKMKHFFSEFRLTKKLSNYMAAGRFVSSMALMIASGMDYKEGLDLIYEGEENKKIKEQIEICRRLIEEGTSFDEAIRLSGLIVGMDSRMITVAAKTGAVDSVFQKLGIQYNEKITQRLKKVSTKIETILIIILAVLVCTVLISVMLPLVTMISSLG